MSYTLKQPATPMCLLLHSVSFSSTTSRVSQIPTPSRALLAIARGGHPTETGVMDARDRLVQRKVNIRQRGRKREKTNEGEG
jgi:hypothetical protein